MQEDFERSSSSLEEKKSNQPDKHSHSFDFQPKTLNLSEFQSLLQTADSLLQKNQVKEAVRLYEQSLNQAEGVLNQEDFKGFFQKTLKDLNIYYLRLMNKRPQNSGEENFKLLPPQYQNSLQSTLQKADETLKRGNIKEALSIYDIGITQALAVYTKPDFEEFLRTLVKELNIYAIKLLNSENEVACFQILSQCDQWTQPGAYGNHPDLRVFIYNHFGCYYRRLENLELALSFLMKALKLLNVSQNEHYLGLTHMNIAAVLSHLGDHTNAKNHSLLSVKHITQAIRKKKGEKCEKSELTDLVIILGISYHNLGNEEEHFRNLDKSHEFFQRSISELEAQVSNNHPLLMKFKAELNVFQEKYMGQLKTQPKNPSRAKKLLYEQEVQAQGFFKHRPKSANPNKKPITQGFNQAQTSHIQANSLKPTDFYFLGNKILRRPKIESKTKKNNFLEKPKKDPTVTQLTEKKPAATKQDFALENSNISSRSDNEINFLEKKGLLDWDSEASAGSDSEKIKKNRENFLGELAKAQKGSEKKPEVEIKPQPKLKKEEPKDNKPQSIHESPQKEAPMKEAPPKEAPIKEQTKPPIKETPSKPPVIKEEDLEKQKEALSKLNEEKQLKANELTELSKKNKNLEKRLDDLGKQITAKAQEIKGLESEESRKNKLLYDQDKEILKKVQELQALEARLAELQKFPLTASPIKTENHSYSASQILKIVRIQSMMRKTLHFFNVERQKTNKILAKPAWTLFPSLEKNQYTKNLLKAQRKVKFLVYLSKPSKRLVFAVLSPKPILALFEHSFDLSEIFRKFRPESPILGTIQEMLPELNNCLVILENKRLCLEDFLINRGKGQALEIVAGKYEVSYLDPVHSRVKYTKETKKGPDPVELENQINLNRRKLEDMKKQEELSKLEEERRKLEAEVIQKKEEKLRELKRLEEQKKLEEKESILAKKELERRRKEQEKAIKLQRWARKRLWYWRFELNTRVTAVEKRKAFVYKGKLTWIRLFNRKHRQEREHFAVFYLFDGEHHIVFRKKLKISQGLMKQLTANFHNVLAYFTISVLMKEVQLRNMVLLGNTLSKLYAHCLQNKKKIQLQNLRQGFDAVAAEASRNVFKKPTNAQKAENNNKKAPPEPTAEAKIGNKTAIKNQMSVVREEEEEEYSPAKTKAYDPIDTVREYLAPLEKKSMDHYFDLRKTLTSFVRLLENKKRKKAFENIHNFKPEGASAQLMKGADKTPKESKVKIEKSVKKTEETPKNQEKAAPLANQNTKEKGSFKQKASQSQKDDELSELLGKIKVEDNLKNRHELEVRLDKKTNQLIINEPNNREIKSKSIALPKENSPEAFFKAHQQNIAVLHEKNQVPEILFYSDSEMTRIKKIQTYSDSKRYQQVIPLKMLKSGGEYELKLPKISLSEPTITFCLLNKTSNNSKNYALEVAPFSALQGKELEEAVIDDILAHLQQDKTSRELVFAKATGSLQGSLKRFPSLKLFLVNFEKQFEFVFDFNSQKKSVLGYCPENREFSVEMPVKSEGSAQSACEKLLLEVAVVFVKGETKFLMRRGEGMNCYEVIEERSFQNATGDCPIAVARLIEREQNIYLMNVNQRKGIFLQEISLIGKKDELPQILNRFRASNCRKLLYELEFIGLDDAEILAGGVNEVTKAKDQPEGEKRGNYKQQSEEEMNNAALKIQNQYKKKKNGGKRNNDEKDKSSLKTIKEENETRSHLMEDSGLPDIVVPLKKEEVVDMKFDEEMDQAAAKIQKHYRNKKKGGPSEENKQKKGKKQKKEEKIEEKVDMELTEEMDVAALKIQKHYKNKKKKPQNSNQGKPETQSNSPPQQKETKKIEKKAEEIEKKPEEELLDIQYDEEQAQAAKVIQGKYRKKQKARKEKAEIKSKEVAPPVVEKEKIKEEDEDILNMKFDEEMEKAAKTIQNKYRKRPKNKKGGNQESPGKVEVKKRQEQKQPQEKISVEYDEEQEKAAKTIQNKYRTKQEKRKKKAEEIPKKLETPRLPEKTQEEEILNMKFDEEMDRAAAKIQQKYRARPKNKQKKQKKPQEEPPKKPQEKEVIDMQFDEEMDKAAAKIQQKYRARPKNKQSKEKTQEEPHKKPEPQAIKMEFDEEMDQAARKIQEKYRKRPKKNEKKADNNGKREAKVEKKEKKEEKIEMEFDPEMEGAATTIQKKYRQKQEKKKKKEEKAHILPKIDQKPIETKAKKEEQLQIEMEFDKEQDDAAKLIQQKYRKKKNKEKNHKPEEKPMKNEEKHQEKPQNAPKREENLLEMEFDAEMDVAAAKIQSKYRDKQKKRKDAEKKKVEVQKSEAKPVEIVYDEEQAKAALTIQKKYKQKKSKSPEKQPKKEEKKKPSKNEPEPEKFTMVIEEGMEDAAKLIQKKYRSKQQKNKANDEPVINKKEKKKEEESHLKYPRNEEIEKKPKNSPGLNLDEEIGEDLNFSGELEDVSQKDIEL